MQDFRKLKVYQEAYGLAKDIYNELKEAKGSFRVKEQLFGCSTAICANIAEMGSFDNRNQQKQKIATCIGEANETEFWLNFCKDVNLLSEERFKDFLNRMKTTRMMLYNLHKTIKEASENVLPAN